MKAGGTIQGMMSMLEEFKANVVGIGVLVESTDIEERLINNFVSLIRLSEVDVKEKRFKWKREIIHWHHLMKGLLRLSKR